MDPGGFFHSLCNSISIEKLDTRVNSAIQFADIYIKIWSMENRRIFNGTCNAEYIIINTPNRLYR